MPKISQVKKDKIAEQILHYLFSSSPEAKFTAEISKEIARDEEFIKSLLQILKEKGFVIEINKNNKGVHYLQRQRWRLSNEVYNAYLKQQHSFNPASSMDKELLF
jgi:predicted transcriptional regulator with HTH domain